MDSNIIFNSYSLLSTIQQSQYITSIVILRVMSLGEKLYNKIFTKFEEVNTMHNDLKDLLWSEVQVNPLCKCSLTFPYMTRMINCPATAREHLFSDVFRSNLATSSVYNIHKKGHVNELYCAFIIAGKTINPNFVHKLYYLHKEGFTLNDNMLLLLKILSKNDFN